MQTSVLCNLITSNLLASLLRKHSDFFPILRFLHVFFRDLEHLSPIFKSCLFNGQVPVSILLPPFETFDQKSKTTLSLLSGPQYSLLIYLLCFLLQNSRICRLYNVLSLVFHSRCALQKQTLLFSLFIIVCSSVLFIQQVSGHILKWVNEWLSLIIQVNQSIRSLLSSHLVSKEQGYFRVPDPIPLCVCGGGGRVDSSHTTQHFLKTIIGCRAPMFSGGPFSQTFHAFSPTGSSLHPLLLWAFVETSFHGMNH